MKIRSVLIAVVACLCAAPVFSDDGQTTAKNEYTATSLLHIAQREPSIIARPVPPNSAMEFDIYRKTQRELVQLPLVLMAALRRPEVTNLPSVQKEKGQAKDPVQWLRDKLTVSFPGNAELMLISCTSNDPHEAAVLTRAVVDAYMSEVVEKEKRQTLERYLELVKVCDAKELVIREKRQELKNLTGGMGAAYHTAEWLSQQQKIAFEEWAEYRREARRIQTEIRTFKRDLAVQNALLKDKDKDANDIDSIGIHEEIKRLQALIAATTEQESLAQADAAKSRKEAERLTETTLDTGMLQDDIKRLEATSMNFNAVREKLDAEKKATSRITILENAEEPLSKD